MGETNGHHASNGHADGHRPPTAAPTAPAIAFEYKSGGKLQLHRVVPVAGSLRLVCGDWWIRGHGLDDGEERAYRLRDIAMFFGTPAERPPTTRCLCGSLENADCTCHREPRAVSKAAGGPAMPSAPPSPPDPPPTPGSPLDGWRRGGAADVGVGKGSDGTTAGAAEKGGDHGA